MFKMVDIAADLLSAIVEHRARGKFAGFLLDKSWEKWRNGNKSYKDHEVCAYECNKNISVHVTASATLTRIYKAHFGDVPDLSEYVDEFLREIKESYGWCDETKGDE